MEVVSPADSDPTTKGRFHASKVAVLGASGERERAGEEGAWVGMLGLPGVAKDLACALGDLGLEGGESETLAIDASGAGAVAVEVGAEE